MWKGHFHRWILSGTGASQLPSEVEGSKFSQPLTLHTQVPRPTPDVGLSCRRGISPGLLPTFSVCPPTPGAVISWLQEQSSLIKKAATLLLVSLPPTQLTTSFCLRANCQERVSGNLCGRLSWREKTGGRSLWSLHVGWDSHLAFILMLCGDPGWAVFAEILWSLKLSRQTSVHTGSLCPPVSKHKKAESISPLPPTPHPRLPP